MLMKRNHQELTDAACLSLPALLPPPMGQGGKTRRFPKGTSNYGHSQGSVAQQRGWQCPADSGDSPCLALLCQLSP